MSNVNHISGEAGGYLVGRRHSTGGIKAINKSTGQPLEMEGGEVVITRNAVSDPTKRSFNGKMMTNREILSNINQSGGGVAFADGGEVPENIYFDIDEEFEYGGKVCKGRDLPAKMTYGTELDDILDSALEEGAMLEEGGQVDKTIVLETDFYAKYKQSSTFGKDRKDLFSWVYAQNQDDADIKKVGLSATLQRESGETTSLRNPLERDFDLLEEFPSGTKMSDMVARLADVFGDILRFTYTTKQEQTLDELGYTEANIEAIINSFEAKNTVTIAGLEEVSIFQSSSEISEVLSAFDESTLTLIQEYNKYYDVWPKEPNYKGYESLMRKVIKGLPDYENKEVVIKLNFKTYTGQTSGRANAVVFVPVKLNMRKVKWSEMSKLIKDKLAWNTVLQKTKEPYQIVLDKPNWGMFEADTFSYGNKRANKKRGEKIIDALGSFLNKHLSDGAVNICNKDGLFTASDNIKFSSGFRSIFINVGIDPNNSRIGTFQLSELTKADFAVTDTEIFINTSQSWRGEFTRVFLDAKGAERAKAKREEAERLERERKAEEARIKAEAEEAERLRKEELANRPFQVRDQPEDEELFDGELIADTEERRLLLADIEAVKRLLRMAQGQALADTRFALIKKLKRLEAKKQGEIIYNESMDVEAQKLISPIGLMNYYFTQARQNPTSVMGKPSGLPTPTGVPSKLDIQSYYAVRTKYFKRWFGDWELAYETGDYSDCSTLVDDDTKEPRLMYHAVRKYVKGVSFSNMGKGVKRPFGTFKSPNFPAVYMGDDQNYVSFYAGEAENQWKPTADYEGFIYTLFVNMRRPISINGLGKTTTYKDLLAYITIKYGIVANPNPDVVKELGYDRRAKVLQFLRRDPKLIEQLKKKGFDGIVQIGDRPQYTSSGQMANETLWGTEYLVFEPTQVKSATVKRSFYLDFFEDVRFKDGGYVRI
jgi:hypothetical protein